MATQGSAYVRNDIAFALGCETIRRVDARGTEPAGKDRAFETIARRTHDVGLLISLASINPARAKAFVAGDDARRTADIAELTAILATLLKLSTGRFHMDSAYDKLLFRVADRDFPLRPAATRDPQPRLQQSG